VSLVNVGGGGALVHSVRPLRPGSRIHVHIAAGEKTRRVAATVQRCGVAAISGLKGVTYAGALMFDSVCDLPWEPGTHRG
jgi:glutamate synthase domain-containing protein 2